MFKKLRIAVLVLVLASVALGTWRTRTRVAQWKYPLHAVVYPINGDRSEASARYIAELKAESFEPIVAFVRREAERYDIAPQYGSPVEIRLAPEVGSLPSPAPVGGNVAAIMLWSLKLRFWAWRADTYSGAAPHIKLFAVYFDPAQHARLDHSLGLREGMIGVANVFAARRLAGSNNVIIAHELLHTVGASDKYEPQDNQPRLPDGYAEPDAQPRYPQRYAEIMGGRIPVSETQSEIPASLKQTLVGPATAREINWIKARD